MQSGCTATRTERRHDGSWAVNRKQRDDVQAAAPIAVMSMRALRLQSLGGRRGHSSLMARRIGPGGSLSQEQNHIWRLCRTAAISPGGLDDVAIRPARHQTIPHVVRRSELVREPQPCRQHRGGNEQSRQAPPRRLPPPRAWSWSGRFNGHTVLSSCVPYRSGKGRLITSGEHLEKMT